MRSGERKGATEDNIKARTAGWNKLMELLLQMQATEITETPICIGAGNRNRQKPRSASGQATEITETFKQLNL